ncbi:MAG TPA: Uma2 family endonuclease [Pirellulales bacterium]|nr:Uma2 family endonuclease [Pirellulales bacterium]
MKAVIASVPQQLLESRRRTGADQWDEMWEGVLHMAPSPNREHQALEYQLHRWLDDHWATPSGGRVYEQINVAGSGKWTENYRIPDLVLLTPERFHIDRNEYFDGGPDAVIEIHGPGDESYEKLEFYSKLGVREVWIIDRDSKQPEIFEAASGGYRPCEPNEGSWTQSRVTSCEMRPGAEDKLEIRVIGHPETVAALP